MAIAVASSPATMGRVEGKHGGVPGVESSSPAAKIPSPRDVIRLPASANLNGGDDLGARSSTARGAADLNCSDTVPWPASSDSLSVHVWGGFSPIFMWQLSQPSVVKL